MPYYFLGVCRGHQNARDPFFFVLPNLELVRGNCCNGLLIRKLFKQHAVTSMLARMVRLVMTMLHDVVHYAGTFATTVGTPFVLVPLGIPRRKHLYDTCAGVG